MITGEISKKSRNGEGGVIQLLGEQKIITLSSEMIILSEGVKCGDTGGVYFGWDKKWGLDSSACVKILHSDFFNRTVFCNYIQCYQV